jgi:lipopolysaccharide/colanic/teichoic acid biosynthesis glycosyltransferase
VTSCALSEISETTERIGIESKVLFGKPANNDRTFRSAPEDRQGGQEHPAGLKGDDFLSERHFCRALRMERRRAERSRRPFLLVLVANRQAREETSKSEFTQGIEKVFTALATSIRETDIWGWYEEGIIGGIIFTEFNGTSKPVILATVSRKLDQAVHSEMSVECLKRLRLSFRFFPEDWAGGDPSPSTDRMFFPDLEEREISRRISRAIKRFIDVGGSLVALMFLSPLFAAIAVAIKLDSKGSVFFRQERVGQYGARFECLKFRSMTAGSDGTLHQEYIRTFIRGQAGTVWQDEKGRTVFKIAQDPRVTKVGRLLRRTSLDELPQLLNVLRGEMSLVGPRPPVSYELDSYHPWHLRRIREAKPGITGLWQVMGRSRLKFDDMVRLDLQYAKTWSLWLDLKILLRTPRAVLSGDGAY